MYQVMASPFFSTSWAPAINYTSSIKVVGYPPFPRLAAFSTLIDYVQVQPRLKAYYIDARSGLKEFLDSSKQGSVKEWLISPLSEIVAELVSRYVYTYPDTPFSREHLLSLYSPMEAGLFQESLPAERIVPILFVRFHFERLEIGPDARIERLDDNFQLARMFSQFLMKRRIPSL